VPPHRPALLDRRTASRSAAIDQPSELGRHRLDRHGSIQPPFQSTKLCPQIAVALAQANGGHAQNHVQPIIRGQSPFANYPIAADSVVRRSRNQGKNAVRCAIYSCPISLRRPPSSRSEHRSHRSELGRSRWCEIIAREGRTADSCSCPCAVVVGVSLPAAAAVHRIPPSASR